MFLQVIKGSVRDREGLRAQLEAWPRQLAAGAQGWLGTTAGVTDDGRFVAVVRFASEEAARRNSDRPEQGRWWAETARHLEGEAEFADCTEVDEMFDGGSDTAGFVQVIEGRTTDRSRLAELGRRSEAVMQELRPDIIGATIGWHDDDAFTQTVYFTSEEEARRGESAQTPADSSVTEEEWLALMSDLRYWDLREPMLTGP